MDLTRNARFDAVVEAEVEASVDNHHHAGANKTSIKTSKSIRLVCFVTTVKDAIKLSCGSACFGHKDIVGEPRPNVIHRINEELSGCTCNTAAEHVSEKRIPKTAVFGESAEFAFIVIFEGEVEGLGGEVPDDIDEIAFVVGSQTFLLIKTFEAVDYPIIGV